MATKKEQLAQEVAKAVGAGKAVAMETVDFGDPNRPKPPSTSYWKRKLRSGTKKMKIHHPLCDR